MRCSVNKLRLLISEGVKKFLKILMYVRVHSGFSKPFSCSETKILASCSKDGPLHQEGVKKIESLRVCGRESALSQIQVEEVRQELVAIYGAVEFQKVFVKTTGDIDLISSLRHLDKSDFFTRELDKMVLEGSAEIAIHSAKDLPDPLPEGLEIIAITKGVVTHDELLMRAGDTLDTLKPYAKVATSSPRREQQILSLRGDLQNVDIRGTVDARAAKLLTGEIDALVVASAATKRLGISNDKRFTAVPIPGAAAPLQGKLAVVAKASNERLKTLFAPIDIRQMRCALYLGLDAPKDFPGVCYHYPIIKIIPRSIPENFSAFLKATHLVFTSKNGVNCFFEALKSKNLKLGHHTFIAVGAATAQKLHDEGIKDVLVAREPCQEGIIELLETLDLQGATLFLPGASKCRPILQDFLRSKNIFYTHCALYDTVANLKQPQPDLTLINEIHFTSPSTVEAFLAIFGSLPPDKKLIAIGQVTESALNAKITCHQSNSREMIYGLLQNTLRTS